MSASNSNDPNRIENIPANPNPIENGLEIPNPDVKQGRVWRAFVSVIKGWFTK